jgi:hypothetical protein
MANTNTVKSANRRREQPRARSENREGQVLETVVDQLLEHARQRPGVAALWCFGIGFVLGWKLKPW